MRVASSCSSMDTVFLPRLRAGCFAGIGLRPHDLARHGQTHRLRLQQIVKADRRRMVRVNGLATLVDLLLFGINGTASLVHRREQVVRRHADEADRAALLQCRSGFQRACQHALRWRNAVFIARRVFGSCIRASRGFGDQRRPDLPAVNVVASRRSSLTPQSAELV